MCCHIINTTNMLSNYGNVQPLKNPKLIFPSDPSHSSPPGWPHRTGRPQRPPLWSDRPVATSPLGPGEMEIFGQRILKIIPLNYFETAVYFLKILRTILKHQLFLLKIIETFIFLWASTHENSKIHGTNASPWSRSSPWSPRVQVWRPPWPLSDSGTDVETEPNWEKRNTSSLGTRLGESSCAMWFMSPWVGPKTSWNRRSLPVTVCFSLLLAAVFFSLFGGTTSQLGARKKKV